MNIINPKGNSWVKFSDLLDQNQLQAQQIQILQARDEEK